MIENLMGLSVEDLDNALGEAKRARDAAELRLASITAFVDATQGYAHHGHRSINTYLKATAELLSRRGSQDPRPCTAAEQHPSIGDALGASRIGVGQVDLLVRAHQHPRDGHRFAEFAPLLTDQAEQLDYADFAIAVKHFET